MSQNDLFQPESSEQIVNDWRDLEWYKDGSLLEMTQKLGEFPDYYPPKALIFRAFELTPFQRVKVVILGQDPYFNYGQATGLAFSVDRNTHTPQSLRNILSELEDDVDCDRLGTHGPAANGDLTRWAEQGVLLLNSILTVAPGKPMSHAGWGWESLTQQALRALLQYKIGVVFIQWGGNAQAVMAEAMKGVKTVEGQHLFLRSSHPSPRSCFNGFFGSKPFSKANDFLVKIGSDPIDWCKQ